MRIKVRASKADDLRKEQQQWQMRYDARKQLYKDQNARYNAARWDWKDNLVDLIKKQFSSYIEKLPYLEIFADYGWRNVEIRFKYADYVDKEDREKVSLRWSYTITLSEAGEVKRETNSWSGFEAVSPEQVDDLMNSANFLKAIVDYDWAPILAAAKESLPKSEQYVGIRNPDWDDEYKDPGYDNMIREAELEENIGKDVWIRGDNGKTWYKIVSATPKFYNIAKVDDWTIRNSPDYAVSRITNPYPSRSLKNSIPFDMPIQTISQEDLIAQITG